MFGGGKKKNQSNDTRTENKSKKSKGFINFLGGSKKKSPIEINGHKTILTDSPNGSIEAVEFPRDDLIHRNVYSNQLEMPKLQKIDVKSIKVQIQRTPTGDFGFVLRKGTEVERYSLDSGSVMEKQKTVHFTEPNFMDRGFKLFPGDKLVEVNNQDVRNTGRDDIIQVIKGCQSEVYLTIQPINECMELSFRKFSNISPYFINIRKLIIEKGSFNGVYNYLYDKVINRCERILDEDTLSLNNSPNLESNITDKGVWIDFNEGFAAGEILKEEGGKCTVKLRSDNSEIKINEEDVHKANPASSYLEENMLRLPHINFCSVIHNLMERFAMNLVHTFIGSHLVCINPMNNLNCYSEKTMQLFQNASKEDVPAHIFSLAHNAYMSLRTERKNQCICVIGRSGSGKSHVSKHILNYLISVTSKSAENTVQNAAPKLNYKKLQAVYEVINAFTCARTSQNLNSNRCGKLFTIHYLMTNNNTLVLSGMKLRINFLDKYRIVERPQREPCFNVFYIFLAGLSSNQKHDYLLDYSEFPATNSYMTPLHKESEKEAAITKWELLVSAIKQLEVSSVEWDLICRLLSTIYHLGMTSVSRKENATCEQNGSLEIENDEGFKRAVATLQCSEETLYRAIFEFHSFNGDTGEGIKYNARDLINGFVCGIYTCIVDIITYFINRCLGKRKTHRKNLAITVIEPPGFQYQNDCNDNQIDNYIDMLYNYTFEHFLHLNTQRLFTNEIQVFQENGINLDSFVNLPKENSIIKYLNGTKDENSVSGKDNEMALLNLVDNAPIVGDQKALFKNTELYVKKHVLNLPKEKQFFTSFEPSKGQITVKHCRGTQNVRYSISNWRKYCRDLPTIHSVQSLLSVCNKFSNLISNSYDPIQQDLLAATAEAQTDGNPDYIKTKSILKQFQHELNGLSQLFLESNTSLCYCISPIPNAGLYSLKDSVPNQLFTENILHNSLCSAPFLRTQLHTYSVLEVLHFLRFGYCENTSFSEFIDLVQNLVPAHQTIDLQQAITQQNVQELFDTMKINSNKFIVGKNKIFFQAGTLFDLRNKKEMASSDFVVELQAICRSYLARKKVEKLRSAENSVRIIQQNSAVYLRLQKWPWWRLFLGIKPLLPVLHSEQEIKSLRVENQTAVAKLHDLESDKANLKSNNEDLESHVERLKRDNLELRKNVERLSEKLETNQNTELQQEQIIQELQEQLQNSSQKHYQNGDIPNSDLKVKEEEEKEVRIEELEKKLTRADALCEKLRRDKLEMEEELDRTKKSMVDAQINSKKLTELKKEQNLKTQLEEERNKIELENKGFKQQIHDLQSQIMSMSNEFDQISSSCSNENVIELKMMLRNLQEELDIANDNADVQSKEISNLRVRLDKSERDKLEMISEREGEVEEVRALYERKMRNLEMQMEEDSVKRQSIGREKRELERRNAELEHQLEIHRDSGVEKKLRRELKSKTEQLEEALDEIEVLKVRKEDKGELKDLRDKNDELMYKLEEMQKRCNHKEIEIDEMKEEMQNSKNKCSNLELKLESNKRELDDRLNEYDEIEDKFMSANNKNVALTSERDQLQHELEEAQEKIESWSRDITKLEKELEIAREDASNRVAQVDKSVELAKVKMRMREVEIELEAERASKLRFANVSERLRKQNHDLETEVSDLKSNIDMTGDKSRKLQRQLVESRNRQEELEQKLLEKNITMTSLENQMVDMETELTGKKRELISTEMRLKNLQQQHRASTSDDSDDGPVDVDEVINRTNKFIQQRRQSTDFSALSMNPQLAHVEYQAASRRYSLAHPSGGNFQSSIIEMDEIDRVYAGRNRTDNTLTDLDTLTKSSSVTCSTRDNLVIRDTPSSHDNIVSSEGPVAISTNSTVSRDTIKDNDNSDVD